MSCRYARRRRRRGFSLVEIMVAVVIIGLLAGIVAINVRGHMIRARQTAARSEIRTMADALEQFYIAYSRYPTNEEGLEVLTRPTEKLPEPLLKSAPTDPWGNDYEYSTHGGGSYEIICYGRDGRAGGDGEDADISSDNLKE